MLQVAPGLDEATLLEPARRVAARVGPGVAVQQTTTMRRVLPDRLRHHARAAQNALRDRYAQAAPPLPPESRTMLIKKYRDDIIELQDLIRRDLRHWLV